MHDLIVGGTPTRIQYIQTAPGDLRVFNFPFQILATSDLTVAVNDVIQEPGLIQVTGVGETSGGEVTLAEAPPVGSRITLWRTMPLTCQSGFESGAEIRAAALNDTFDRLVLMAQQVADEATNAVRPAPTDAALDLTLPPVPERAGRYLSFDAQGRPETVTARIVGDIQNLGLVYLGAHPGSNPPELRLNGTALQRGDLFFDIEAGVMRIRRDELWVVATISDAALLRHDGSLPMTGDLDLGGNDIVNPGLIDGRNIAQDGATLDALVQTITEWEFTSRSIAIRNAWDIAQLRGLGAHALANTYLDTFEDLSGLELGQRLIPGSDGTVISGTDGTMHLAAGFRGPDLAFDGNPAATGAQATDNPTYVYVGKDWGQDQSRVVTRVRAWGESEHHGFAEQAGICSLRFQGSQTGAWSGEEVTLWSDTAFEDPGGAHVEFAISDTSTAYRYHRLLIEETVAALDLHIMELDLLEGQDSATTSAGLRPDTEEGGIANGAAPSHVLSSESQWLSRAGVTHTGDSIAIAANAGAVRTGLPFIGNFDLDLAIAPPDPGALWRVGFFAQSEIGNFNPSFDLGGLPIDPGSSNHDGIENGIGLAISQTQIQLLKVEQNVVVDQDTTSVSLLQGDVVSVSRRDDVLTVKVNSAAAIRTDLSAAKAYFPVLGSHTTACTYDSVSWTILHDEAMTLISKPVTADGPPDDAHIQIELDGVHRGENNLTHSNDFLSSNWTKSGVTASESVDPEIAHTIWRMEETETTGVHAMIRIIPIEPGRVHTASLYARAGERTKFRILWGNQSTSSYGYAIYDLGTGTVSTPVTVDTETPFAAEINSIGNGWFRCSITGRLNSFSNQGQFNLLLLSDDGETSYVGNQTQNIEIFGSQLEVSDHVGPYYETSETITGPRIVLDRDVELSVSRDGGTTWRSAMISGVPFSAFDRLIARYFCGLSGGPSGQDIRLRLRLDRPQPARIRRWAIQTDRALSFSG